MRRLIFLPILIAVISCNTDDVNLHESHIIYGTVTDSHGRTVEGVKVIVNEVEQYTNSSGEYSLPFEGTGTIVITATPPDPVAMEEMIFYDEYTSNEIVLDEHDIAHNIELEYKSDIEIYGLIEKNVYLYKANSPINIPYEMAITAGNSVTIEHGSIVKLGNDGSIYGRGNLIAKGIKEDIIRFIPMDDSKYYETIIIDEGDVFEYCEMSHAGDSFTGLWNSQWDYDSEADYEFTHTVDEGLVVCEGGSVSYIKLRDFSDRGVTIWGTDVSITNLTIEKITNMIMFVGSDEIAIQGVFKNSEFFLNRDSNFEDIIYLSNCNSQSLIEFKNCNFYGDITDNDDMALFDGCYFDPKHDWPQKITDESSSPLDGIGCGW